MIRLENLLKQAKFDSITIVIPVNPLVGGGDPE